MKNLRTFLNPVVLLVAISSSAFASTPQAGSAIGEVFDSNDYSVYQSLRPEKLSNEQKEIITAELFRLVLQKRSGAELSQSDLNQLKDFRRVLAASLMHEGIEDTQAVLKDMQKSTMDLALLKSNRGPASKELAENIRGFFFRHFQDSVKLELACSKKAKSTELLEQVGRSEYKTYQAVLEARLNEFLTLLNESSSS